MAKVRAALSVVGLVAAVRSGGTGRPQRSTGPRLELRVGLPLPGALTRGEPREPGHALGAPLAEPHGEHAWKAAAR